MGTMGADYEGDTGYGAQSAQAITIASMTDSLVRADSPEDGALERENTRLRHLLAQAGIDASRLLAIAGIDAAAREATEKLQRLLLEEVHHRLKNTLATVMAIISQSLRSAQNTEQAQHAIASRLIALGRAHDLLLQENWSGAKLAEIVRAAIEPYDARGAPRFSILCADIDVGTDAVVPLAMVLNELCTNAVKYGALSSPKGRIEVAGALDAQTRRVTLMWTEKDGPIVGEPTRRSFGSQLIEKSLARVLHGESQLRFEPAGVVCEFNFPLGAVEP